MLQRLAGNRATAALLKGRVVQRACGPGCDCVGCQDTRPAAVQRIGTIFVQRAASPGVFNTNLTPDDQTVAVSGRNAADWNSNAQTKIGGEGGKVQVSSLGDIETSISSGGVIDGANAGWKISKTVPSVDESGFTNDGEKNAAKALADRVGKHEGTHKDNEMTGRKDFAKTLKGKKDSAVDGAVNALECRIGKTQRALDNQEGLITLDAGNNIQVSGKDHPEYENSCGG